MGLHDIDFSVFVIELDFDGRELRLTAQLPLFFFFEFVVIQIADIVMVHHNRRLVVLLLRVEQTIVVIMRHIVWVHNHRGHIATSSIRLHH